VPDSTHRFGRFELRSASRLLLEDGRPIVLGARAYDVLLALVERRDRVVSKTELLDLAWPGVVVEENNLQVQVSTLRKILGADAIATIPGRGYRLTLDVGAEAAPAPATSNPCGAVALPRHATAFIGREAELASYAQMLPHTRVLTLTAVGGCGKTRLAIELARAVSPGFSGGTWFVDLAPVAAPDRVPLAVMSALGVREDPQTSIIVRIGACLEREPSLLVLDNCEHVLDACRALVEDLLSCTTAAKVIATSRERLGIAAEQVALVPPLSLAGTRNSPGATTEASDAVRLFLERARLAAPDAPITRDMLGVVDEVCRRLEGLPLAIELAAARMKVLSIGEIRTRLDDRFALLTASGRVTARHQTLRGVIEWSYEQLEPSEQEAFRRLSVFAGGCTLEAAAAVATPSLTELDTIDVLARLVDKSLVLVDRASGPATRYRMLETVREYAREQLERAGDADGAGERHLRYFVELAERTGPSQRHDASTLARLDAELDNVVAAHDWCAGRPSVTELDLRLVAALTYWFTDRHLRLGRILVERTLSRCGEPQRGRAYAGALRNAGRIADELGDHVASLGYLSHAVDAARASCDVDIEVDALLRLGGAAYEAERLSEARVYLTQALAGARAHGMAYWVMGALMDLGELNRIEGRLDDAARLYEEALDIQRANGFVPRQVEFNLSIVANERGDYAQAARYLSDMSRQAQGLASPYKEWCVLQHAAALAAATGDAPFAARMWGAFDAVTEATGLSVQRADEPFLGPRIDAAKATLGASAFGAMLEAGRALSPREALAEFDAWTDRYLTAAGGNAETDAGVRP
jgi:non-specific serine/threonine protein kinase